MPGGAPSKLTAKRRKVLIAAVRAGNSYRTACRLAGIAPQTLCRWFAEAKKKNAPQSKREFCEQLKRAEAERLAEAQNTIRKAAKGYVATEIKEEFAQLDQESAKKLGIADRLRQQTTDHWLGILQPADIWCAPVMDWPGLLRHEAFESLDMLQTVSRRPGVALKTTRCPLRIDGQRLGSPLGAPAVGQHNASIVREYGLDEPAVRP